MHYLKILSILLLLFFSMIAPITFTTVQATTHYNNLDKYYFPEYSSTCTKKSTIQCNNNWKQDTNLVRSNIKSSAWPMFGHDIYHTGRCSYNTTNNLGEIIWSFWTENGVWSSPVIADDGTIYFGSPQLYAINPNGTARWSLPDVTLQTAPVIDDTGIIYCGNALSAYTHFYAIYPNGTTKWCVYFNQVLGSPVITGDGIVITPESVDNKIVALYSSNGTRKWEYQTNDYIYSSPAIGFDGTIYCGCHDGNIYALYQNGSLRWKFLTGTWVHGSPSIGTDGTVYCGSDNGYLYALDPVNGTMKWRLLIGESFASPTIDSDGILYIGVWEKKFYAINPNGTIKWIFDTSPGKIWGSTAALSGDGTLYFGTCDLEWSGGIEVIALWINGTIKWRKSLDTIFSSPAISKDGTVYIGSQTLSGEGYLNAFGSLDPNAPTIPAIQGPPQGKIKKEYSYTFSSIDPLGKKIWYYITWGDGSVEDWIGPYSSGEIVTLSHSWNEKGTYVIEARAKNTENLWGPWGELEVTRPYYSYQPQFPFIQWLFERFPHAFPMLRHLLDY